MIFYLGSLSTLEILRVLIHFGTCSSNIRETFNISYELLCYILFWKSTPQWTSYYVYENMFISMKGDLYLTIYWFNYLFIYFHSYDKEIIVYFKLIYRKRNRINFMDLLKYINISKSAIIYIIWYLYIIYIIYEI